ncbi:DUF692 family multinuclear iron-containing protein [Gracilibacillus xinjiangensis]|uniref:DUF692 family multinuclear iron-containing protein n=1 Tax=Gracilibacillus xinjiangensis TaxID=1193282 RepID=A0ABV8WXC0_9BACI
MKLAVNYSLETEKLVKDSVIDIDMFKCPDFSKELIDNAKQTKPCYVHFALNAGDNQMNKVNWTAIEALREETNTPFVNVHAVAFVKDYPDMDTFTSNPVHINRIIDAVIKDLAPVMDKFGAENVMMENVICRGENENMMRAIIEPEILSEIMQETGCGLLLDTAHAQMTSKCLGLDVKQYISQLPLDQLKELHITGIQPDNKGRLHDSMPMTDEDWDLAKWVIQRIKAGYWQEPWVAAFEYGGVGPIFEWRTDEEVLAKQTPILYELVK